MILKTPINVVHKKTGNLDCLHKSAIDLIPEFQKFKEHIRTDADLRSLCSQAFARAFFENILAVNFSC